MKKSKFLPPYYPSKLATMKTTHKNSMFKAGVYLIKENETLVYIGYSKSNLYKTLYRHFQKWDDSWQDTVTYFNKMTRNNYKVRVVLTTPAKAKKLETALINKYKPRDNKKIKYQKLTLKQILQDKELTKQYFGQQEEDLF